MENNNEQAQGLQLIDSAPIEGNELVQIMTVATDVIAENEARALRVINNSEKLVEAAKASGMTQELDELMNKHLVKGEAALAKCKNDRAPITQFFDKVRKRFTGVESAIADSFEDVKKLRNQWAAHCKAEADRIEQERQAQLKKAQELISIRGEATRKLRKIFEAYTNATVQSMQAAFQRVTLETWDVVTQTLLNYSEVYPFETFAEEVPQMDRPIYHPKEIVDQIVAEEQQINHAPWAAEFATIIRERKARLQDQFDGKRQALKEAQQAAEAAAFAKKAAEEAEAEAKKKNDAEAARRAQEAAELAERARLEQEKLRAEKEEAEKREAEKLANEAAARAEEATRNIAMAEESERVAATFDAHANAEEVAPKSAGRTKDEVKIEVLNNAGWLLIVNLWYQIEGKKMDPEKIGSKKLDSMKTACEKHADKTGERIDSAFLKYKIETKAIKTA